MISLSLQLNGHRYLDWQRKSVLKLRGYTEMYALLNSKKESAKMSDDERVLECQKKIKRLRLCIRQEVKIC